MPPRKKHYWLFKSEPDVFGFSHLCAQPNKRAAWDGVRNFQARNLLRDQVKKGDRVKVASRRGSIELAVEVDGRGTPPRGSVFVPFFDESRLINRVTLDAMDNISKQPDYKKCAVKIERV